MRNQVRCLRPSVTSLLWTLALVLGCGQQQSSKDTVATPSFSPAAGSFGLEFDVTLACATPGAVIHFTTDGSTPTADSTAYAGPVHVADVTTTVKAIATRSGARDSAVATATYTFDASLRETVATPAFTPGTTSSGVPLTVTIATTTAGASLHYTLDGSPPTAGSTPYEGPITISATTTVRAIGTAPDLNDSEVASATYTLAPVELGLDDGVAETTVGVGGSPVGTGEFMWLNRFTPSAEQFPFTVRTIRVVFPTHCRVGDRIELLVYSDADGDPTSGMTLETSFDSTVQFNDGTTWSVYPLPGPVELPGPGDMAVGVLNRWVQDGVTTVNQPASLDTSSSAGRSWLASWTTAPADPPTIPADAIFKTIDYFGIHGSWLIRASNY